MSSDIQVLFIDDDRSRLNRVSASIEDSEGSFEVVPVSSGEEAIDILRQRKIDAVISQGQIPDMDSFEFLREIPEEKDIPFMIFSAGPEQDGSLELYRIKPSLFRSDEDHKRAYDQLSKIISEALADDPLTSEVQDCRQFFESIPDWVWEMDMKGVHTYSNSAVKDLLGYDVEEIVGSSAWEFWPQEDREKTDKEKFVETLEKGEGWENFTGRFSHKDGSLRYLQSTAVPIYDENDELVGYRGVDRDITERVEMKERKEFLHSLLRHDVGNKAQLIDGYLQLVEERDLPDKVEGLVSKAREETIKAEGIIEKVRTLKELTDEENIQEIELCPVLRDIVDRYNDDFEGSEMELDIQNEDVLVYGGPLMDELFSNLLENTLNHADSDRIRITCEELEDEIRVKVEDDGRGISEDMIDELFDKGFKGGRSTGSGLGLYLVKEIAESYGGEVKFKDSELGGARFDIILNKV